MAFPTANPFNLVQGDDIVIRAFASNSVGRSNESAINSDSMI
jgi:hypothetical protein